MIPLALIFKMEEYVSNVDYKHDEEGMNNGQLFSGICLSLRAWTRHKEQVSRKEHHRFISSAASLRGQFSSPVKSLHELQFFLNETTLSLSP